MAHILPVKDRGQEEDVVWGEEWGGWEETAPGQVPVGIVCVLAVGQGFLTKPVLPAIT